MFYCWIYKKGRPRGFIPVKGRTWSQLRRAVGDEMKKPDSLHWNVAEKRGKDWAVYRLGHGHSMKRFPLTTPPPVGQALNASRG